MKQNHFLAVELHLKASGPLKINKPKHTNFCGIMSLSTFYGEMVLIKRMSLNLTCFAELLLFWETYSLHSNLCIHVCCRWRLRTVHNLLGWLELFQLNHRILTFLRLHIGRLSYTLFHLGLPLKIIKKQNENKSQRKC